MAKPTFTKGKNVCFTAWDINFPPIWKEAEMNYLVYQAEITPETNKFHWQGYVELKSDRMAKTIKKLLETGEGTNLAKRLGTGKQASDYCKKEETSLRPYLRKEFGTLSNDGETKRGSRTDLKNAELNIIKCAKEGKTLEETMEVIPGIFLKYGRNFKDLYNMTHEIKLQMAEEIKLFPWQEEVLQKIAIGFIKRQIIWIWSHQSATGKSTFMDYLVMTMGSKNVLTGSWKEADLLYSFNAHKVIAFNIPRKQAIHDTHIAILEKVSDGGAILSTKYDSKMKIMQSVIIVFANIPPPHNMIPKRITEYCIDPPNCEQCLLMKIENDNH